MREKILNVGRLAGLIFDCIAQACLVMLTFIGAGFLAVLLTNIWSSDGISGLGKLFFTGLLFLGAIKIGVLRTRMRETSDDIQYVTGQLNNLASDIGRLNDMLREVLEAQLQATLTMESAMRPVAIVDTDTITDEELMRGLHETPMGVIHTRTVSREELEKMCSGTPDPDMTKPIYYSNVAGSGHDYVKKRWSDGVPAPDFLKAVTRDGPKVPGYVPTAQEVEEHDERKRQERIAQIKSDLMQGDPNPGQRKGLYEELQRLEKRVDAGNWPDPDYQPIKPDQEHVVLADEETQECRECSGTGEGIEAYSNGNGAHCERTVGCPDCGGNGFIVKGEAIDNLDKGEG